MSYSLLYVILIAKRLVGWTKPVILVHCLVIRDMNVKPWTPEGNSILRSMRLDPVRTNREKLIALIAYFQKGGGIWSISEGGKGPITISRGLARKVRDLVFDHKLDWLQVEEAKLIEVTMETVSDKFPGIEVSTLSEKAELGIRGRLIKMLGGRTGGLTVVGPSRLIKKIKKEPQKISLLAEKG